MITPRIKPSAFWRREPKAGVNANQLSSLLLCKITGKDRFCVRPYVHDFFGRLCDVVHGRRERS